jgi:hypothetical protein
VVGGLGIGFGVGFGVRGVPLEGGTASHALTAIWVGEGVFLGLAGGLDLEAAALRVWFWICWSSWRRRSVAVASSSAC